MAIVRELRPLPALALPNLKLHFGSKNFVAFAVKSKLRKIEINSGPLGNLI
jgi:hypothetical protein